MTEIGIRALKQNASAVVARAAAGEVITVTDRGRPVAQLSPLPQPVVDRLVGAGQARPPKRPLADLPEPRPNPAGGSLSQSIIVARDDERS